MRIIRLLAVRLQKFTDMQAAALIALAGFAAFSTGLTNPFQGDDSTQIVTNIPVHSIANIGIFFRGGTFYNGQGLAPLIGAYYRPLMSTTFSLLYTLFGPHPFYFHLFQLLLYIGSAIVVYLVLKYYFKPLLALFLSLVFVVHPLNSQVVFAIPSMGDVLYFFFGIVAVWIVHRFESPKSMWLVALCLFLSMLSKEAALGFIVMVLVALIYIDVDRIRSFIGTMILPTGLYLILKSHAVGLFGSGYGNAPMYRMPLAERLLNIPSILLFYFSKFVFPWRLASGYYWATSTLTFRHFVVPLIIDCLVIGAFAFIGLQLHRRKAQKEFKTYVFFAAWTVVGLSLYLQIIPVDMTVCETWFYFPMVGALGLLGVILASFKLRGGWILPLLAVLLLGALGIRSAFRGFDYRSQYTLTSKDITVTPDYTAYNDLSVYYLDKGDYGQAKTYAEKSVALFPFAVNDNSLGNALFAEEDYSGAYAAYTNGLKYLPYAPLYENLGKLAWVYGNPNANRLKLANAIHTLPQDPILWMDLAILEDRYNDNPDAKVAATYAAHYGTVPTDQYDFIMHNKPFLILLYGRKIPV